MLQSCNFSKLTSRNAHIYIYSRGGLKPRPPCWGDQKVPTDLRVIGTKANIYVAP
jgi:hypothetical protein